MPLDAPVTIATLSASLPVFVIVFGLPHTPEIIALKSCVVILDAEKIAAHTEICVFLAARLVVPLTITFE
jgi:hypothetical protein